MLGWPTSTYTTAKGRCGRKITSRARTYIQHENCMGSVHQSVLESLTRKCWGRLQYTFAMLAFFMFLA